MNITSVSVIILLAVLAYLIVHWARMRAGPPLPTKRRRIAALELEPVCQKAMKRHGWDQAKATALEAEYRDFLILLAENDGKTVSPWSDGSGPLLARAHPGHAALRARLQVDLRALHPARSAHRQAPVAPRGDQAHDDGASSGAAHGP